MPSVDIPGVGVVQFPDNMGREEIAAQAQRLHAQARPQAGGQVEAGTGRQADAQAAPEESTGQFNAAAAPLAGGLQGLGMLNAISGGIPGLTGFPSPEVIGGTLGGALVPPLGVAARGAGLVSRLGRLLGSVGAAGAGGLLGGGAQEAARGGTPQEIIEAGTGAAARQAGAEGLGQGLAGAAARIATPAAGLLDDAGRAAIQFVRENVIPGQQTITGNARRAALAPADVAPGAAQRTTQAMADFLIPSRAVTQKERRNVTEKVLALPPDQRNEMLTKLVRADTSDAGLATAKTVADKASRAIGVRQSASLGFETNAGPRNFISRLFREGDVPSLKKRMSTADFNALLEKGLESIIVQASRRTQGGQRVIDGEQLFAAWENLPDAVKSLYPEATRKAMTNYSAFARASQRVPEFGEQTIPAFGPTATTIGATGLAGGPAVLAFDPSTAGMGAALGAGVAALTAKSLMKGNGLLNRWLTKERVDTEVLRAAGPQLARLIPRNLIAPDARNEDDDTPEPAGGGGLGGLLGLNP